MKKQVDSSRGDLPAVLIQHRMDVWIQRKRGLGIHPDSLTFLFREMRRHTPVRLEQCRQQSTAFKDWSKQTGVIPVIVSDDDYSKFECPTGENAEAISVTFQLVGETDQLLNLSYDNLDKSLMVTRVSANCDQMGFSQMHVLRGGSDHHVMDYPAFWMPKGGAVGELLVKPAGDFRFITPNSLEAVQADWHCAWDQMEDREFARRHDGEFVAVYLGEILGTDADEFSLRDRSVQSLKVKYGLDIEPMRIVQAYIGVF